MTWWGGTPTPVYEMKPPMNTWTSSSRLKCAQINTHVHWPLLYSIQIKATNDLTNVKFLSVLWIFSYRKWIKTEMVSWPLKSSLRPVRRWLSYPLPHDSYSVIQKQFCTTRQGSVMSLVNQTMTKIIPVHTYAVKHHSCFWDMLHFPISFFNYFHNLPLLLFSSLFSITSYSHDQCVIFKQTSFLY